MSILKTVKNLLRKIVIILDEIGNENILQNYKSDFNNILISNVKI